jgi:carboxypeptidase T
LKNALIKKIIVFAVSILLVGTTSTALAQNMQETLTCKNIGTNSAPYNYYTYQNMTRLLKSYANNHSDIMNLTSIGKTYQGRDIWMVKISDNVSADENEPGVLFMGAHHGNEKPSYEVLIYFIKYLVDNYEKNNSKKPTNIDPAVDRVKNIVNNTQIYIIPMVNPDGVEANSRKNCAPNHGPFGHSKKITSYGVNLNRNYDYRWYLIYLHPQFYVPWTQIRDRGLNYHGPYPFSENETIAVKKFVETHNISISISYHTFSQIIFYPWLFTSKPNKDEKLFISIGENISKINNYTLTRHLNLPPWYRATIGGSEDWLYGRHNILAFLIELGKSSAPKDPKVVSELCRVHTNVNLYVCERAISLNKI